MELVVIKNAGFEAKDCPFDVLLLELISRSECCK